MLFNVTDAVSSAPNHGITRTERQLARALAVQPEVEFVAHAHGRLVRVDRGEAIARMSVTNDELTPTVERFGVDPPVTRTISLASSVRARVRGLRARRTVGALPLDGAPHVVPGDVLVSVGLDWVHGILDEIERIVYGDDARYVGFCYDLIPIDHPEWLFPADPVGFQRHLERMTRVASSVLCISESTRHDFLRHFADFGADNVRVLPLGADAAVTTRPEHDRFAASLFDGEPFAVYCATIDRRKNHQLLYRVAQQMQRRGDAGNFVFVGRTGSGVDDLIDCLRHDAAVRGRFAHVMDCDDQHLAAIYRRARFAVYPSLYEGWGLGVTEALAHGTPCIVATGSSLGEAGLGVCPELHPLRTAEWTEHVTAYFDAPPVLPTLDIPTWAGAAEALLELVRS